ncbi:MAG: sodium ion-translocating decarboxylase subunit beta [Ruminococcaceae bacterium]|nr:sodium ion-translocating decarboxylase subunit beta [Oscillospiraceae bacterium]
MKRAFILILVLCCSLLTACDNASIGIIGGADGPTAIIVGKETDKVKGKFGEQLEKKPVRMINVDGELYYDSGYVSKNTPRCGTLDGKLKRAVAGNEIPLKSGVANFDTEGYQHATGITKEVNIDGDWIIFKKYDTHGRKLDNLKYCYYIKGHLNNAVKDSEIIVLSENDRVTFNDIYDPLLSSTYPLENGIGNTHHNPILYDEWGIHLYAEDVTESGMTLKIEQFGGEYSGSLQTGEWFSIEPCTDGEWKPVPTNPLIDYAWLQIAYLIKSNDITELDIGWKWLYGELPPGQYRLKKEISDYTPDKKTDKKVYEVYFTVE